MKRTKKTERRTRRPNGRSLDRSVRTRKGTGSPKQSVCASSNKRCSGKSDDDRPILLVFSDDWGRHPSSSQHLIGRLLDRYEVLWVNTIGTRIPRLDWITFQRGAEKLISWTRGRRADKEAQTALDPNPRVLNPPMLPSFRSGFCRSWNRRLLSASLGQTLRKVNPAGKRPVIGITTLPYVSDLIGVLPVSRWVYYCVDDWSAWPGMDARPLAEMERDLLARVDSVICVSQSLQDRVYAVSGRESSLLTHGFDERFLLNSGGSFGTSGNPGTADGLSAANRMGFCPGRKIVYWGLSDERLDGEIVAALSRTLPNDSLVFVGPQAQPPEILSHLENVFWLGIVPFVLLPEIARQASVLIMPYTDSPVTRQIQPLKMLEYLATGKPVVARNLPAMRDWLDCMDVADTPDEFARLTANRLESGASREQIQARERIKEQTWEKKVARFERLIRSNYLILHE